MSAPAPNSPEAAWAAALGELAAGWAPDAPRTAALVRTVAERAQAGHACVPLEELAEALGEAPAALRARLPGHPLVAPPEGTGLLVLDRDSLYLHRLWRAEVRLAGLLRARLAAPPPPPHRARAEHLRALFSNPGEAGAEAVARLTDAPVGLVVGGPGTGKTTLVARLLALLQLEAARPLAFRLAAPTGRAAQRLTESLRRLLPELPPGVQGALPEAAETVHRLLEAGPQGRFGRGRGHPVAADVVVVDEASMLDLALAARLAEALPPRARLILLGDAQQLPSVGAGAVLAQLDAAAVLAPHRARLRRAHRFGGEIAEVCAAVAAGRAEDALAALRGGVQARWVEWPAGRPPPRELLEGLGGWVAALARGDGAQAVTLLGAYRALAPLRAGPRGLDDLNRLAARAGGLEERHGRLPAQPGLPFAITRPDAALGLANGDHGVFGRAPGGKTRAYLAGTPAAPVPAGLLPGWEPACALTVHRAQGSEFDRVAVVLPEQDHPLLSRELLFTALSRARQRVEVFGPAEVFAAAVARAPQRSSHLAARLDEP